MERIIHCVRNSTHAGKGWAAMKKTARAAIWGYIALALILAGCGNNSTGDRKDPPAHTASIIVEVHDSEGNPLSGFEVFTSPATSTVTTDAEGKASLVNLEEGGYSITVRKSGYISFSRVYTVAASFPLVIALTYVPHFSLTIRDEKGRPAAGAVISADPPLPERILDQNGKTEYENLPLASYNFLIKRDKFPDAYLRDVTPKPELELVLESSPPQMTILSPQQNAKIASTRNIRLSGKGSDIEDGELPDSSLVWYSDRIGELGRGRNLVVEMLPAGSHAITLAGTDTDGKRGEVSIEIRIFDYYLDTYFPTPAGDTWDYRVLVPEFYVTDESGLSEFWSIKQLTVRMNDGLTRDIVMQYDVARGIDVFHCVYTLTDHLQIEGKSIYITATQEEYTESTSSVPSLKMNISTDYVPRYLLFKNFLDPSAEKNWATKSDVTVNWVCIYYGKTSLDSEWASVSATFSLGDEQSIQTDKGAYPAYELTIQERGGARKWMLAKGLGIIRIADGNFDPPLAAILHDSSILRYSTKALGSNIARPPSGAPPPRYDLRIDRKNARDVRKLCKLLSGMCIR